MKKTSRSNWKENHDPECVKYSWSSNWANFRFDGRKKLQIKPNQGHRLVGSQTGLIRFLLSHILSQNCFKVAILIKHFSKKKLLSSFDCNCHFLPLSSSWSKRAPNLRRKDVFCFSCVVRSPARVWFQSAFSLEGRFERVTAVLTNLSIYFETSLPGQPHSTSQILQLIRASLCR